MFDFFGNNPTPADQQARARHIDALRATQQARAHGANPKMAGNPHGIYAYQPSRPDFWEGVRGVFDPSNVASIAQALTNPAAFRSPTPAVRPQQAAAEQNRNRNAQRQQAAAPSWVGRIPY